MLHSVTKPIFVPYHLVILPFSCIIVRFIHLGALENSISKSVSQYDCIPYHLNSLIPWVGHGLFERDTGNHSDHFRCLGLENDSTPANCEDRAHETIENMRISPSDPTLDMGMECGISHTLFECSLGGLSSRRMCCCSLVVPCFNQITVIWMRGMWCV